MKLRYLWIVAAVIGLTCGLPVCAWAEVVPADGGAGPAALEVADAFAGGPHGDNIPDIVYDQGSGKLKVDVDGSDLFSLIIPGPAALSIDDWQDGEFKYGVFWTQAYFDAKEQWAGTNMRKVADGVYQIATYAPGLTENAFGPVEYGLLSGAIQYGRVEVIPIPEPGTLVLLASAALALWMWRRR